MAGMKKRKLSQAEIDEIVTNEAEDPSKWEEPVLVKQSGVTSIRLSSETISKARRLAKIHKSRGYQTWLKQVIEERIRLEEDILSELKEGLRSEQ
jgi:predicted transcriptional regulator